MTDNAITVSSPRKLGMFAGVFTPTVLTILGVIMYFRLGYVVGNGGMLGAIAVILLAHVITISTGLSVSSIVTNTRVGAGGAFAIISRALGLEVGGSVGIPLFIAQGISVALYLLGFAEGWQRIFPDHPMALVTLAAFIVVFGIAYISAQLAARTQFLILAVVAVSLVSIALGSVRLLGAEGFTETPVLWGPFEGENFWSAFAIFFPAVTGIMTGISLSGDLRNARRAIPLGTMSAIALTLVIYLLLVYWLARVATPEDLISNTTIMVDEAVFGPVILAGMLGATFSSALGSLVAAPRVMQALAEQNIIPFSTVFARRNSKGEPRAAMLATGAIALGGITFGLLAGGLNAVSELITLFFLITYGSLNLVVLVEQMLNMVSFRPSLRVPKIVPFVGVAGCIFVMFLVNPAFSLVAVVMVGAIYGYLLTRDLTTSPEGDVRSGLFMVLAEWAGRRANALPSAPERTWKPTVLVPVRSTGELAGSYRFLRSLAYPQGSVHVLGIHPSGQSDVLKDLPVLTRAFQDEKIYAQTTYLEEDNAINGLRVATQILRSSFLRPNILFLRLEDDTDLGELQQLVDKTAAYRMGIVLLARHPVIALGREKDINVWIADQGPDWNLRVRAGNHDLAMLMAYQLASNWTGRIRMMMAVRDEKTELKAQTYLSELVDLARLPASTEVVVSTAPFMDALKQTPRADLNIFGLSSQPDLALSRKIAAHIDASCVFVRDSGDESAFA